MFRSIQEWAKNYSLILGAIAFVLGTPAGWLAKEVFDVRSDNRKALTEEVEQVEAAARVVEDALDIYVAQARGQGEASDEDLNRLQSVLVELDQEVRDTARHDNDLQIPADQFVQAMVDLRDAAADFDDAYVGAREFVEALSEYQYFRSEFETAATRSRRKFRII